MAVNETTPLLGDAPPNAQQESTDVEAADEVATAEYTSKQLIAMILPLGIGVFMAAMDQTIVVSSYAAIGSELKQLQNTSWIATGYMLTLASFQPLYGKLSDIFGRKTCVLVAYSIFGLGSLLCGLARNMNELILARALAGIGGGGMTTVVSIILSDVVPIRSRGTWQGFLNIIFASGSFTGAPLGGLLTDSIGWRWAFLVQVPPTLLAISTVAVGLHLPHTSTSNFRANLKRVDFAGAISLVLTIFFLLVGLERGGNIQWSDNITVASLVAFAVGFLIFAVVEVKIANEPFAPVRIVFSPKLIAGYLVNFFGIASALPMVFHLSLYLQAVQDKTPSQASLWLIPSILFSVCGSLMGGLIIQSTGKYYWLTFVSYIVMFLGATLVVLFTGLVSYSPVGILAGFCLTSLGNGTGITTTLIAIVSNAGPVDQAVATATSYLYRSLGSVLGISVASTIVQSALRKVLSEKLAGMDLDVEEIVRRVRESLDYIKELTPEAQIIVKASYEEALRSTFIYSAITAGCALAATIFIKEKELPKKR